jgi:hypothetical protein
MTARWIAVLLIAAMPAWGQSPSQDRFVLTAGQVARALSDRGRQTTDEQVSLQARVVATEPYPVLDILSVEPLGKRQLAEHSPARSRVKLACHLSARCLPFYAIVSWSEPTAGPAAVLSSSSRVVTNELFNPGAGITMRAGTHATLVMDDDRSHIQVAVISLENGIAGHRIRVSSPDHKQVYFGEVVSASLLKGSF